MFRNAEQLKFCVIRRWGRRGRWHSGAAGL